MMQKFESIPSQSPSLRTGRQLPPRGALERACGRDEGREFETAIS